jgi:hypothetical protein
MTPVIEAGLAGRIKAEGLIRRVGPAPVGNACPESTPLSGRPH